MMYYNSPGESMKYKGNIDNNNIHQMTHVKTEKIVLELTLIMGQMHFHKLKILDNIILVHKHTQYNMLNFV